MSRLLPLEDLHTVTASIAHGCSCDCIRLQLLLHTVAATIAYGCSLCYIRLQLLATMDGVVEAGNVLVVGLTNRPELLDEVRQLSTTSCLPTACLLSTACCTMPTTYLLPTTGY